MVSAGRISAIRVGHLERLHTHQNQVGLLRRGEIVGAHVHAPLRAARDGPLGVGHGGVNLVRSKKVLLQEGLHQNAAHLAGAQHGHADFGAIVQALRWPQRLSQSCFSLVLDESGDTTFKNTRIWPCRRRDRSAVWPVL